MNSVTVKKSKELLFRWTPDRKISPGQLASESSGALTHKSAKKSNLRSSLDLPTEQAIHSHQNYTKFRQLLAQNHHKKPIKSHPSLDPIIAKNRQRLSKRVNATILVFDESTSDLVQLFPMFQPSTASGGSWHPTVFQDSNWPVLVIICLAHPEYYGIFEDQQPIWLEVVQQTPTQVFDSIQAQWYHPNANYVYFVDPSAMPPAQGISNIHLANLSSKPMLKILLDCVPDLPINEDFQVMCQQLFFPLWQGHMSLYCKHHSSFNLLFYLTKSELFPKILRYIVILRHAKETIHLKKIFTYDQLDRYCPLVGIREESLRVDFSVRSWVELSLRYPEIELILNVYKGRMDRKVIIKLMELAPPHIIYCLSMFQ